jgi:DNA-binding MarR family transcriptional regulator
MPGAKRHADDRPSPMGRDELALLLALHRVMKALPRAVDADLQREHRLQLTEFRALWLLAEAPEHRMRMSDLAGAQDLSLSGMTRVVGRLEAQGLVERVRCEEDARGWLAVLTDTGLACYEQATPVHLASVREHLFDHLEGLDVTGFTRALEHAVHSG